MNAVGEPNGTLRYRVESLEKEQERTRARIHDAESSAAGQRLSVQRTADALSNLDEDVKAVQKALVSVQRSLWGLVITGMTVAVTLLSGLHLH